MWVPAQESIRFPKYFSNLVVHIIYVYFHIVVVTALSVGYSYFPLSMAWGKHGSNAILHLFTWSFVHWKCLPPFEWMWHPKMTRAHGPWIMSDSRCKDSKNVYTLYVLFFLGRGKKPFHRRYSELFTPHFMVRWPVWFGIQGSFHVRSLEAQKCAGRSGCVFPMTDPMKTKTTSTKEVTVFEVEISRSAWWRCSLIQPKSRFVVSNQDLWLYIFLTNRRTASTRIHHVGPSFQAVNGFLQRCHRKEDVNLWKIHGGMIFSRFFLLVFWRKPKWQTQQTQNNKNFFFYGRSKKEVWIPHMDIYV